VKKLMLTLVAVAFTAGLLAVIGCGEVVEHDPDAHLAGSEEEADGGNQTIPEEGDDSQ
jgi:hypothetical protein